MSEDVEHGRSTRSDTFASDALAVASVRSGLASRTSIAIIIRRRYGAG